MIACPRIQPGFLILRVFVLLVVVHHSSEEQPTLWFNPYSITFPGDTLQRLYKCLCDDGKRLCQQEYTLSSSHAQRYWASDNLHSETVENEEIENAFTCHPGSFTATGSSVRCERIVRSPDRPEPCKNQEPCHAFHLNLNYQSCKSKCVNVYWSYRSVAQRYFEDEDPKLEPGASCEINSSPHSSSSGNQSLVAAAAVGWVFFAILLGLNVAYVVYRMRKSKQTSSQARSMRSEARPNAYESRQNNILHDAKGNRLEIIHPLPAQGEGNPAYDACAEDEDSTNDYTVIDEVQQVPMSSNNKIQLDDIKAVLSRKELPEDVSASEFSETPANAMDKPRTGNDGYSFANSRVNLSEEPRDTANGYTVLEGTGDSHGDQMSAGYRAPTWEADPSDRDRREPWTPDYDKLNGGRLGPAAAASKSNPTTYNTGASLFEDFDRTTEGAVEVSKLTPYDKPRV